MKDTLEIERRFILRDNISNFENIEKLFIVQLYLPTGHRLRCEQSSHSCQFIKTLKTVIPGKLGVREQEENIEESEFLFEIAKANRIINKTRYTFKDGDVKWDIDTFPFNLIIGEVEMPSEDYTLNIHEKIKPLILTEVTNNKDLSNFRMSTLIDNPIEAYNLIRTQWNLKIMLPDEIKSFDAVMSLRKELKHNNQDENFVDINSWLMGVNWCKDFYSK